MTQLIRFRSPLWLRLMISSLVQTKSGSGTSPFTGRLRKAATLAQLFVFVGLLSWTQRSLAQSVTIVGFNMSTQPGGANNFGASPLAPTTTATNVTATGLTRGSGVSVSGTGAARGWGGTGWNVATASEAITASKFATFTVKANDGYTLSLNSIDPFSYRRSATGPPSALIQYQINSGGFTDITTVSFPATTAGGGQVGATSLSGITALQNLPSTTTVTFRIVPFGASGSGGTWYIFDVVNTTADDLAVTGTVTSSGGGPVTPSVSLAVSPSSGSEAATTVISVSAIASSAVTSDQTVSLAVTGTGITAGDYTLSNTTITIPSGSLFGTVTFTIVNDTDNEGTETATLTISSPSAGITLGSH